MFKFLKAQFAKIYSAVTSRLGSLFTKKLVDEESLYELEKILIEADTGVGTTRKLIKNLQNRYQAGEIQEGIDLKVALKDELISLLEEHPYQGDSRIYILVGVNGTGKTTFAAKLSHAMTANGKKVILAAADTFRAAATEQLAQWAKRANVPCVTGGEGADPAAVVFKATEQFVRENADILIIDTAGRLQNKANLMRELEKIKKVIARHLPEEKVTTLLTTDSMLGQNSLDQARMFHEAVEVNGIVLTKMDGTGKGGIIFSISDQVGIPIAYLSFGEQISDMSLFDARAYVSELLGN